MPDYADRVPDQGEAQATIGEGVCERGRKFALLLVNRG